MPAATAARVDYRRAGQATRPTGFESLVTSAATKQKTAETCLGGESGVMPPHSKTQAQRRCESAFTLAECLAALLFLAIVIPVAIEALHVASLAGEVAARKGEAARVADRVLNESLVETNWTSRTGTESEGNDEFHYSLNSQNWPQDSMQLLTAEVTFSAQGHEYSVTMSTLANLQTQATATGATHEDIYGQYEPAHAGCYGRKGGRPSGPSMSIYDL